ncbi:ATP-binding protein [Emticicia sp. BO119]|uniref:HD domain-containing protein n=1 Tax=Emticicia sp. BO119 TaxID=2757768 RepID=UPI0015EFDF02|nr:ATP-binding protein [Emticicia sp. BO119]MBA4849004.1 ATP-binding protein [Emticicia sp. BO119]
MVQYLEQLLLEKTKGTPSDILYAKWSYDKKVIPTALNAVSALFPHFSLHDSSHSETILNNIVRVLGKEKIAKLSAIDIWLMLEAAYIHDIGMVVPSEDLIEALKSVEFITFFKSLIENKKDNLHEFANKFEIVDKKICYTNKEFSLEVNDGMRFILAEFFRWRHGERSENIVNNPYEKISLDSPTGVIPIRIKKVLGKICSCHTKDFTDVMNLPFCEVGIDVEDAHPRFIACMLRIGDLLDLDNNRFSEVMLRTLTKAPTDSLNHKDKHLSIEYFRVDQEKIEITASCNNYDVANITQHWFNYLNTEITEQTINWNKIIPTKEFGLLPTLGNLIVNLKDYDFIDGKNKPKFKVDSDKALELLQGSGIYDSAFQCIREILQNAVDATLIKIWLDHNNGDNFKSPNCSEFLKFSEMYTIEIEMVDEGIENEWQKWEIKIKDKGIGISKDDLIFLMNTGSSGRNQIKTEVITNMPVWMKPSGYFGIGFQSIFMITDVVNIDSKSYFTEELQKIQLNSPHSKKDGAILIQKQKTTHSDKPGSKIQFTICNKAIPEKWRIDNKQQRYARRIINNYDPFANKSLDIEYGKIYDEILAFARKSYIPISLKINNEYKSTYTQNKKFNFFDSESSLELNIFPLNNGVINDTFTMFYKNQEVETKWGLKFLNFEINIHKDNASKVLTLNRNHIRDEYISELSKDFMNASFRVLTNLENFNSIFINDDDKVLGSMFINYYSYVYKFFLSKNLIEGIKLENFQQWQSYEFEVENNGTSEKKTMITLLNDCDIITVYFDADEDYKIKLDGKELSIISSPSSSVHNFLLFITKDYFKSFKIIPIGKGKRSDTLILSKNLIDDCPIEEEFVKKLLRKHKDTYSVYARQIIPCLNKYKHLRLKDNFLIPYVSNEEVYNGIYIPYPKMLSPYIREENLSSSVALKLVINNELIDWVYNNKYYTETTKEQIEKAYEEFCNDFHVEVLNSD